MRRLIPLVIRGAMALALIPAHAGTSDAADGKQPGADNTGAVPGHIGEYQGRRVVRLNASAQSQGGMELYVPEAAEWRPELSVQGKVPDIQPLLQLRGQYNQTLAERDAAQASLNTSDTGLHRLTTLHDSGADVSARQLQEALSQRAADFSRVRAAEIRLRDIRDQTVQNWGPVLTGWALDADAGTLDGFIGQQEILLLITFGPDQTLAEGTKEILVSRNSDRLGATPATLISAAPYTDGTMGETYFFRAPIGQFRIGMRAYAWAPANATAVAGVFVPDSAVVWYAGRPWVYVRHEGELFARHPVAGQTVLGARWFVPDRSLVGVEIVKIGGQMLLSEESRGEIPDEDNNP